MEQVFFQYGALGAIALVCIIGMRVVYNAFQANYERERESWLANFESERERADRLEAELGKLNEIIRTEYVTTISTATRAISDALAAVRRVDR